MNLRDLLILLTGAVVVFLLTPVVRRTMRERRMRRAALAIFASQMPPSFRRLPLSRADKRGFETDRDGWLRPR